MNNFICERTSGKDIHMKYSTTNRKDTLTLKKSDFLLEKRKEGNRKKSKRGVDS